MVGLGGAGAALGRDETQEQGPPWQGERPRLKEGTGRGRKPPCSAVAAAPEPPQIHPHRPEGVTLGGPVPARQAVQKRITHKPSVTKARPDSKLILIEELEVSWSILRSGI